MEPEINDLKGMSEMRQLRADVQKVLQNFFVDCRKPNPKGETRLVNYEDWGDTMIMIFIDNGWKSGS